MKGEAGVVALLLAETLAGGAALLFLTPLWNEVKRGFFKLTGSLLFGVGLATWGAISAAREPGAAAAGLAEILAAAFSAATFVWVVLLFARRLPAARLLGFATLPVALSLLVALAGTSDDSHVVAFLQLLAGAVFLGAVVDGLLLGHWYLTDRGLTRGPINRFTAWLIAAVALEAVAVFTAGFGPVTGSTRLNPLLAVTGVGGWIAIGMVAATALVAVMIRLVLRGTRASAVQAATGFFYLAVVFAFVAEFATKVRLLEGS